MTLHYPIPSNTTTLVDLFSFTNTNITDGYLGIMFLMAIFVICLVSTLRYGLNRSFIAAAFITDICSVFLTLMGMVGGEVIISITALLALSVFLFYQQEQ